MTAVNERVCRPPKELLKFSDRARGDDVDLNRFRTRLLKPFGMNLDISKSQGSYSLGQKSAFLLVGFNQGELYAGARDFERQAWKSGSTSNVGEPTVFHRQ
jgi:hypothetical protein